MDSMKLSWPMTLHLMTAKDAACDGVTVRCLVLEHLVRAEFCLFFFKENYWLISWNFSTSTSSSSNFQICDKTTSMGYSVLYVAFAHFFLRICYHLNDSLRGGDTFWSSWNIEMTCATKMNAAVLLIIFWIFHLFGGHCAFNTNVSCFALTMLLVTSTMLSRESWYMFVVCRSHFYIKYSLYKKLSFFF